MEKEKCVMCGEETPYMIDTPIDLRNHYVEGGGQLCKKCYNDTFCERTVKKNNMESTTKTFELQVDKLPLGYTIRLNDEKGCVLRICQIPAEVIEKGEMVDVIYPKKQYYEKTR